jgi:dihydroorotase
MAERYLKFKGFRDVHVHFRDPGMPIAETRRSGAAAAAAGGFTCVTTMPNTTPAGDSVAWLREQIEDTSLPVRIAPSACISKGRLGKEIADLERLAEAGAVAFTDDGSFVDDENLMRVAMRRAAALGKPVGSDAANEKVTYITLCGLEATKAAATQKTEEALSALQRFDGDTAHLEALALALLHRDH